MENEWFTVAETEKETNIPHQTIRRYIKTHGHHLILKKKHKSYFINGRSIKVILEIRNLYSQGKTSEEVDNLLSKSGVPMTFDISVDREHVSISVPDTLLELKNDMNNLLDKFNEQEKFNQLLLQKLAEQNEFIKNQQKYIDDRLSKRDEQLMFSLKEVLETKKMIAAAEQSKKKWWKVWFKS